MCLFAPAPHAPGHGRSAQRGSDPVKLQPSLGVKWLMLIWTHCTISTGLRCVGLHSHALFLPHGLEIHKGNWGCSPLQAPITCPGWISRSG